MSDVSYRAIAAESSKKELQRTVLGVVQPGDTIPIPYGWHKAGEPLHTWQLCTAQSALQPSYLIGYIQRDPIGHTKRQAFHSFAMNEGKHTTLVCFSLCVVVLMHTGSKAGMPFPLSSHKVCCKTNQSLSTCTQPVHQAMFLHSSSLYTSDMGCKAFAGSRNKAL